MRFKLLFTTFVVVSSLVACGKKTEDNSITAARQSGARSTTGTDSLVASGQYQWINLTSQNNYYAGGYQNNQYGDPVMQQNVSGFVSAFMNPNELGRVNQLSIKAMIRVDATGNVDATRSQLAILIRDSYAGTTDTNGQQIPEIPVLGFSRAAEIRGGQGQGTQVVFKDSYGEVIVSLSGGSMTPGYNTGYSQPVTGTVSYRNYTNFDGSTQGTSGTLGYFYTQTQNIVFQ